MHRILVSVEGQTEEIFVATVLRPHLLDYDVALEHVILKTKRAAGVAPGRGGVSKWSKIEPELRLLLRDSNAKMITTMYDLYGLPTDTPGWVGADGGSDPYSRARSIESEVASYFADQRLAPYLQVHEFEALLFAAPDEVAERSTRPDLSTSIADAALAAGGPELVDDGPATAPSKRLEQLWPAFTKTLDGPAIVRQAGLAKIRSQCPKFDEWLRTLEAVGTGS